MSWCAPNEVSDQSCPLSPAGRRLSRRGFLQRSAAGVALASLLSACGGAPPAPTAAPAKQAHASKTDAKPAEAAKPGQAAPGGFSGGGSLKMLVNAHFVPAYDAWLDRWAADWGAKNKVDIEVDHLLTAEFPAKVASEVAS